MRPQIPVYDDLALGAQARVFLTVAAFNEVHEVVVIPAAFSSALTFLSLNFVAVNDKYLDSAAKSAHTHGQVFSRHRNWRPNEQAKYFPPQLFIDLRRAHRFTSTFFFPVPLHKGQIFPASVGQHPNPD
jgi:hypothetical protein